MCPDGLVVPRRDIWSLGVPLRDAPYEFAHEELRKAGEAPWQWAFVARTAGVILEGLQNTEQARNPQYAAAVRQIREADEVTTASIHAHIEMADQLLAQIREGRCVAYGYKRPRGVNDCRIKIPADLFERKYVDWNNSAINGPDLKFMSVLVFESGLAAEIDAELARERPTNKNHRKRGPEPNSFLEKVVHSLIDDESLRKYRLQKEQFALVRKHAIELYPEQFPNGFGLSNESIRKVLVKLIPRARN
ncbi:MAG TPA: hypothetical protein VGR52_13030 [Stellaceae bacterium]|nr:hypothetical protein [Stellaceae bacterium]